MVHVYPPNISLYSGENNAFIQSEKGSHFRLERKVAMFIIEKIQKAVSVIR
jgi:hypothetical protein